jgi:hypothetical protein
MTRRARCAPPFNARSTASTRLQKRATRHRGRAGRPSGHGAFTWRW